MSRGIARLGDKTFGVCKCHKKPIRVGGVIVSASSDTITDGRGTARLGDMVKANCGHTGIICTASSSSIINGRGTARLGDSIRGCYNAKIVTASSDRFTL
jgi:uncharacterized Zn-binding protein involved in type VI secretion